MRCKVCTVESQLISVCTGKLRAQTVSTSAGLQEARSKAQTPAAPHDVQNSLADGENHSLNDCCVLNLFKLSA